MNDEPLVQFTYVYQKNYFICSVTKTITRSHRDTFYFLEPTINFKLQYCSHWQKSLNTKNDWLISQFTYPKCVSNTSQQTFCNFSNNLLMCMLCIHEKTLYSAVMRWKIKLLLTIENNMNKNNILSHDESLNDWDTFKLNLVCNKSVKKIEASFCCHQNFHYAQKYTITGGGGSDCGRKKE